MAVPYLQIDNLTKSFGDLVLFENISFGIAEGQRVGLIAKNGTGKTTLLNVIAGKEGYDNGNIVFRRDLRVDYLEQDPQYPEELTVLEACFHHGNSTVELIKEYERCMETDGHPGLDELLVRMDQEEAWEYEQKAKQILSQLKIRNFDQKVKQLSGGQLKRVALANALITEPDLLILDEPFDGLDVASRQQLAERLASLHQSGITLVLVLNRFDEIPEFVQFAGVLADCTLAETGAKEELLQQALVAQLAHSEQLEGVQLPEPDEPSARHALPANEPRIVLNNGVVSYNDRPILNNLSWQVNPGEHWQIVGPNGAGKSTLLSLVTGDHPQGYSNDLTLFGRRRGSGETIWDIKKHIGYVSSSLHLDYRVSTTVRNVILSGYFDSIGIYQAVSDRQQKLVQQWLDILGIDKHTADAPFHSLSWGQQRLALIVRALVKHPTLLILDEPLQGLDPLNRQLIRRFVDVLISEGETQLLFVSHHAEDAPACITHRLEFVPDGGLYRYVLTKIY